MKKVFVAALLSAALLMGAAETTPLFAQVSLGVRIGPPPAPRVLHSRPRQPGPEYVWVEGYWYPSANGKKWVWHNGYWTRPPFGGARWVAPHHDGDRFYNGYWENGDRRMDHDHHWDHERDRDYRDHDHDRDDRR
jgi:hypothetical protein